MIDYSSTTSNTGSRLYDNSSFPRNQRNHGMYYLISNGIDPIYITTVTIPPSQPTKEETEVH